MIIVVHDDPSDFEMNEKIKIFRSKQDLAEVVKQELIHLLESQTSIPPLFNLALAGGSTPRVVYERWATIQDKRLWSKVHFFWGDERCVPPEHPESNYKMAYDALLSKIPLDEKQIHRIRGEESPETEAQRYSSEIRDHLPAANNLPQFDWILLGVGGDGHTASLFPNSQALNEQKALCIVAQHPQTGQNRISLTLPLINNAKRVTFLVTGEDKAEIIREIIKDKSSHYPAARVKPLSGVLQWHLDEEAAGKL